MKKCSKCNIEIGGSLEACPLCRTKLTGEDDTQYWPEPSDLKKASRLYKAQFIIVLIACVAVAVADIIISPPPAVQWWPLFILWAVVTEIVVRILLKRYRPLPEVVTECAVAICILLGLTSIWFPHVFFLIPIILAGMVILDLGFVLADKNGYSMVFFIFGIFISAAGGIIVLLLKIGSPLAWYICLGICAASFLTVFIVKGKFIFSEIKRRLSM